MSDPLKPARNRQWANSYESQLSDGDLLALHTALLARKPSDKQLIQKLPVWRDGPYKGQPVSPATLSNIRDRLLSEINYADAQANAMQLVRERSEREPGLSEADLEEFGNRVFTELTITRQDMDGFVTLRSARTKAQLEKAKLDLRERELALAREKFKEELRGKVEAGIDALAEELKSDPAALAVLAKARERSKEALK